MDQSPKAKELIHKYERETRNDKWFRVIFDRLQKLRCCVKGEINQESQGGDEDIPPELTPCLVEIPSYIRDSDAAEIKSLTCREKHENPRIQPLPLKDLAKEAYNKSKSSRLRRRRRRHVFYQTAYSGGFQSLVGDQ